MTENQQQMQMLYAKAVRLDQEQRRQIGLISAKDEAQYIKALGIESMSREDVEKLEAETLMISDCSFKTKLIRFIKLRKKQLECLNQFERVQIQKQNYDVHKQQQSQQNDDKEKQPPTSHKKIPFLKLNPMLLATLSIALILLAWSYSR